MVAIFFTMYLWYRWMWIPFKAEDAEKPLHKFAKNKVWLAVSFIFLLIAALLMAYSRFILGVHSLNQLVYGFLLGVWGLVVCLWYIDPLIREFMDEFRAQKSDKA